MEEVGFVKFKQFLGGNKCNLGELSSWKTVWSIYDYYYFFFICWVILEYINENKLPQDHPCVIETIRRHYLKAPSPPDVPLNLVSDSDEDRSPGQTGVILRLLKNQV
jgi:hypothetical protein